MPDKLPETRPGMDQVNEATCAAVSRLLVGASPIGAYAMGMLCVAVWTVDPSLEIPEKALVRARGSQTLKQGSRYANNGREWALAKAGGETDAG